MKQPASGRPEPGQVEVRMARRVAGLRAVEIRQAALAAAEDTAVAALSIAVVADEAIARLHHEFMGLDSATDVLTFDLRDDPAQAAIEGEIVISAETAQRQGHERGLSQRVEVLRYVVHGVLHLRGYKDATAAQQRAMRRKEDRIVAELKTAARP